MYVEGSRQVGQAEGRGDMSSCKWETKVLMSSWRRATLNV